jgi:hypothetical protein
VANLPDYITATAQADINSRVKKSISSANAVHTIRNDSWISNFDGTVVGAIQLEITGLYNRTMSGAMEIVVTQNNVTDGAWPDMVFWLGGNWRSGDHTWHNTEARVETLDTNKVNVRFADNGVGVFMVIGDVNTSWSYPRVIIRDVISNDLVAGYTPEFVASMVTTMPSNVSNTISVAGMGVAANFNTAFDAAMI